jgi:hypothetical protein
MLQHNIIFQNYGAQFGFERFPAHHHQSNSRIKIEKPSSGGSVQTSGGSVQTLGKSNRTASQRKLGFENIFPTANVMHW